MKNTDSAREPATVEEAADKFVSLDIWDTVSSSNWIVKPTGTAVPYFCTVMKGDGGIVRYRLLMIEGWQTFHDYIRGRIDPDYGFYSTPMEIPHYELAARTDGRAPVFRHDAGYGPLPVQGGRDGELCRKILWQCCGVAMRMETDPSLPMSCSQQQAMFGREESASGEWSDKAFPIPQSRPYTEKIAIRKDIIAKVKDLPFKADETLELDFGIDAGYITSDPPPRFAYLLSAVDAATGEKAIWMSSSVNRDGSLKKLWEDAPEAVMIGIARRGRVPGEIKVRSGRVFRFMRPLCMELPLKLSMHASLPMLEKVKAARLRGAVSRP